MRKLHYLYADFETTTIDLDVVEKYKTLKDYYENHPNPKYPEVYSWSVLYEQHKKPITIHKPTPYKDNTLYHEGVSGKSFIKFIESIEIDAIMYFNNLKGFDGHFLIPILDAEGYKVIPPYQLGDYEELPEEQQKQFYERVDRIIVEIKKSPNTKIIKQNYSHKYYMEYIHKQLKRKWNKLLPNEYSVIADGNSKIYEIKIGLPTYKRSGKTKTNRALVIRDNLILFPSSIANMGKTLAKKHNDKSFLKKELDNGYTRTELYKSVQELRDDGNELEYLVQDTFILYSYHKELSKHFPRKDWKMTIGSTSYKQWRLNLGKSIVDKLVKLGDIKELKSKRGATYYVYRNTRYNTTQMGEYFIGKILPTKWLDQEHENGQTKHEFLYQWYDGGITHINEQYRGQFVNDLTFLDINSSYPSQQVKETLIPTGIGEKGNVKGMDFKFYKLIVKKPITNKKGLPFLHNFYASKREYLKTLKPNSVYLFTSITLPRFLKYYNPDPDSYILEVEYSFNAIPINKLFKDFVEYWYEIKEQASKNGEELLKTIAKLFLNNVYGKLGTKSERESKEWNQQDVRWETHTQTLESNYYLPLAIAITEMGRMDLVDSVDFNYHQFVYCDTDSIAIIGYKPEDFVNVKLDPSKLGYWDIEYDNMKGIFRRPKQYFLKNQDDPTIIKKAFAGINFSKINLDDDDLAEVEHLEKQLDKLDFIDFVVGRDIPKQLSPYRVLGYGLILQEQTKRIKPVWEYEPLSEQIYYKPEHFETSFYKCLNITQI